MLQRCAVLRMQLTRHDDASKRLAPIYATDILAFGRVALLRYRDASLFARQSFPSEMQLQSAANG